MLIVSSLVLIIIIIDTCGQATYKAPMVWGSLPFPGTLQHLARNWGNRESNHQLWGLIARPTC